MKGYVVSPVGYAVTSLFQGTNGSQLWDTAFALQAFLEVMYEPVTLYD